MHTLNLEKLELFCFKLGFALLLKENKHNKMVQDLSIPPLPPQAQQSPGLRRPGMAHHKGACTEQT